MEADECTICLEAISHAGILGIVERCNHVYHGQCISSWAKHSNTCPTCRRKFHRLQFTEKGTNKSLGNARVQDKLLENAAINDIPSEFIIPRDQVRTTHSDIPNGASTNNLIIINGGGSGSAGTAAEAYPSICCICNQNVEGAYIIGCYSCYQSFHVGCLGLHMAGATLVCPICDVEQSFVSETVDRSSSSSLGSRPRSRRLPSNEMVLSNSRRNIRSIDSQRFVSLLNPSVRVTEEDDEAVVRRLLLLLRRQGSRRGLVIHNENNELDDDFLYGSGSGSNQSSPETYPQSSRPVLNGGVLLRKELRIQEQLSEEEVRSWQALDEIKQKEHVLGTQAVFNRSTTTTINSTTNTASAIINESPRRKRRRRRVVGPPLRDTGGDSTSGDSAGETRISSLINQIKHSNNTPRRSIYFDHHNSNTGPARSPLSSSSSAQHLPIHLPSSEGQFELTLEQKQMVQKHIRNALRTIYIPNGDPNEYHYPILKSETEYIEVNKTASRRIYRHIVEEYEPVKQLFEVGDDHRLQRIVDEFVNRELRAR